MGPQRTTEERPAKLDSPTTLGDLELDSPTNTGQPNLGSQTVVLWGPNTRQKRGPPIWIARRPLGTSSWIARQTLHGQPNFGVPMHCVVSRPILRTGQTRWFLHPLVFRLAVCELQSAPDLPATSHANVWDCHAPLPLAPHYFIIALLQACLGPPGQLLQRCTAQRGAAW